MADVELLQAEIELLRAEVERVTCELMDAITRADKLEDELREAREFRDKLANAIGNDQLRRFIEKHGEPVPLTIRMQEAESRAERLAEASRQLASMYERATGLLCPPQLRRALAAYHRGASND